MKLKNVYYVLIVRKKSTSRLLNSMMEIRRYGFILIASRMLLKIVLTKLTSYVWVRLYVEFAIKLEHFISVNIAIKTITGPVSKMTKEEWDVNVQ